MGGMGGAGGMPAGMEALFSDPEIMQVRVRRGRGAGEYWAGRE
jgi:hypothetical protein